MADRPDRNLADLAAAPLVALPPTPPAIVPPPLNPMLLAGVSRAHAAMDLTLVLMAGVVVQYASQVLFRVLSNDRELPHVGSIAIVAKWLEMALAVCLMLHLVLRAGMAPAAFGVRADSPLRLVGWSIATLTATYAYVIFSTIIVVAVSIAAPQIQPDMRQRLEFVQSMPIDNFGLSLLLLIPVAVHEEILFRALLLPYLRRILGSWVAAVAVSSLIFGALHFTQGALGAIQVTGVGIVFAVAFIATRSLTVVCVAHFAFNLIQFQLARLLPLFQRMMSEQA